VRAPNPTPESLEALSRMVVVTPRAGPLADFIRKNAPAVSLAVTEDYEESLARVLVGQAVAAALNASAGGRIAARLYPNQFTIPKIMFYEQPLALGVPKGRRSIRANNPIHEAAEQILSQQVRRRPREPKL